MIEDIEAGIEIAVPPGRVWAVLTGEGLVEEWLGCLQFETRTGHVFYMQPDADKRAAGDTSGATHCQIEGMHAPGRFVFSWYYPETPKTRVEIILTEIPGGGTHVNLRHTGWKQFDATQIRGIRDGLAGGWSGYVLPGLKSVAERKDGLTA
jgi:uncharacterized protein YndB with AHSA1/START domain